VNWLPQAHVTFASANHFGWIFVFTALQL
jgi:hypothetical protein